MAPKLPSREYGSKPANKGLAPGSQIYDYDHYSGANVSLYIGDILIDEITSVQYRVEQQKRPIYGYSSYNWDFVAKGTTFVQGNFTINFKESGYLYLVLKHVQENGPIAKAPKPGENTDPINRDTIEKIVHNAIPRDKKYDIVSDLAALPDKEFEDVAEAFEDQVWGKSGRNLDPMFNVDHQRSDYMDAFDIFITFGNIDDHASNHTVRRIRDIELIGQSQLVEISGEPIQEAYTFIAKDVI